METIVEQAATFDVGGFAAKPTTLSAGQEEAFRTVWSGLGNAVETGIWECTPGSFTASRDDYHEICVILSGSVTVHPKQGEPRRLSAGDLLVTPMGWSGVWDVHETVRKVYVIVNVMDASPSAVSSGES